MADFAKAALNIWCGKKKLKVNYEVTDASRPGDNAPNFRCEVRDPSFQNSIFISFSKFTLLDHHRHDQLRVDGHGHEQEGGQ